ncbi:hypothetical protein ABE096_02030 [Robertmurraya massiliosenegalensis]|uniref:hypothetical protein n=1 Tax=Robertmurraya TaxID=2837507 RepID=UPI0039A484BE
MKNRRDKWTDEENHLLRRIVLEHVQMGATKTAAFKKAAALLGRTPAACGHRWNHVLSKEEGTAATTPTPQLQLPPPNENRPLEAEAITLNTIIQYLQSLTSGEQHEELAEQNKKLQEEYEELKRQSSALEKSYNKKKEQHQELVQKYETIAKILTETESLLGEHVAH